jgi:hypothetical protein
MPSDIPVLIVAAGFSCQCGGFGDSTIQHFEM